MCVHLKVCVQVKLMSECSGSVNDVKRVKLILNDHEDPEDPGLSCAADTQTATGTTGGLTLSRFLQPKMGRRDLKLPNKSIILFCNII